MDTIKYSCVAVDDEAPALDKINRFIQKVPFLKLNASFSDGLSAMAYIKNNKTDILFLDIQMDDLTGLQLVELLDDKPIIIFTTAYEQYALKGYELDVSDYLLKPYAFDRFLKSVNKAVKIIEGKKTPPLSQPILKEDKISDFIFIKTEYRIQKVFLDEILYIEGQKDYLKIITKEEGIMTLMNFSTLLSMLPANNFIRVHKSYVVALDKIQSIERDRILMAGNHIPVGESFKQTFFARIARLSGGKINKHNNPVE